MKSRKISFVVLFSIFIGIVVGLVISSNLNLPIKSIAAGSSNDDQPIQLGATSVVSEELQGLEGLSKAFVAVSKEVSPAVVTINSQTVIKRQNYHPFMDDEFFKRFFRMPEEREQSVRSLGSGVIVNPDGYILTNNHVVNDANEITVVIDKEEYEAEIIGKDPESDLAVIKIEKDNLPTVKLGNSDDLEVGEWVLAIGNPFSDMLQNTVTSGIVSAKGRSGLQIGGGRMPYQDFIQTDAAINPGNSGGALVNLRGELIGINTAIVGQANVGIGFAIPINLAKNVMKQLINDGRVIRGWLGVYIADIDENMAKAFEMEHTKGALVQQVVKDSPAEKAGLVDGDVITKVEDVKIENSSQLTNYIATFAPDSKINVTIWREGKEKQVTVKLGERPADGTSSEKKTDDSVKNKLGIEVEELSSSLRQRLGYETEEGVIVSQLESNSVAAREGIREGDLIMSVNRKEVKSVKEFNDAVKDLEQNDIVLFRLKRGDTSFFRALRIPKDKK